MLQILQTTIFSLSLSLISKGPNLLMDPELMYALTDLVAALMTATCLAAVGDGIHCL